eukprot:5891617-Prorocentrum_lima.AAC.1
MEDAIDKVFEFVCSISSKVPSIPSANKWLSTWPLCCDLATIGWFHQVPRAAMRHACGDAEEG